ncbi:NKAP family protein CG6066-like isoform X2 [Topomyia yanbarensis]|uniref:NKAP family protein CG6066-like isoform X2 n=1 Tax=Topomyia yanbarensis TaxID=2498891 RepID=UPI00273A805D|nr:NKAP family protein CG6066-like isoform X2 [Topomyia yanbarensis]
MRMMRFSRGRPDYRGRGSYGRFRGGRRGFGRYMHDRRYDFEYNRRGWHSARYEPPHNRFHPVYDSHEDNRYQYHSPSYRYERDHYSERRYRSSSEIKSISSSMEKDISSPRNSRGRARKRSESRDSDSDTRDRSSSTALSNISSGSSLFERVDDSDAYVSPDYDELSSQSTEEKDDKKKHSKRKKRKKEKKKREKERRQRKKDKKRKKEILEGRICPPDNDVNQSKDIFSSGKNILVSVSFGEGEQDNEREPERAHKRSKKKKSSRKKSKSELKLKVEQLSSEHPSTSQRKKRKLDENIKPVAIIDLERSPGKQVISSPREVIVLSDEEINRNNLGSISTVSYPEHHRHHRLRSGHHLHQRQTKEARLSISQTSDDLNSATREHYDDGILDLHPSSPMDHLSPRAQYLRLTPHKGYRPSPNKKSGHQMANATITSGAMALEGTTILPFGEDMDDGDISPYSPRSSDCDDHMFDPPVEGAGGHSANGSNYYQPKTIALTVDNLRRVFGDDKNTLYGDLRRPNEAVALVDEMYKPQKVTMEMLDDMPSSAVDLQIKEKLIAKLQRQDRIIEEVKHFLKPHFNKKRLNKDEYKDIMKKSVPKICHSRSGEINPVKIQNLITAYVKKAIAKRRLATSSGNAIVSSTTAVT